jgi:CrcB protein
MMLALLVATAGAAGAVTRFLADGAVQERTRGVLPWGTITVNVAGSFALGVVTGLVLFHGIWSVSVAVIGTGFCGGLTTWSTASWETVRLAQAGEPRAAIVNALGGLVTSLAAATCGLLIAAL